MIKRLILFIFLMVLCPSMLWGATETFYLTASGDASAPETLAGAFDASDFNTAGNWDTDDQDDGKIGLNDEVLVYDDDGVIRATLTIQQPGASGTPITIKAGSGESPIVSGADNVTTSGWADQGGNVWRHAIGATSVDVVIFDDSILGTEDATPDSKYEWTYSNPNLDVYATADPDNGVYYTLIEAGQRSYAVNITSKDYVNVKGLILEGANSSGIQIDNSSNVNFTDSTVRLTGDGTNARGIFLGADTYNTDNTTTIDNITITNVNADGIFVQRYKTFTISNCIISNIFKSNSDGIQAYLSSDGTFTSNSINLSGTDSIKGCITAESDSSVAAANYTLANNICLNSNGHGLGFDRDGAGAMESVTIDSNFIYNCNGNGINFIDGPAGANVDVINNIIIGNNQGINFCGAHDRTSVDIYNNTIHGSDGQYVLCVEQFDGNIKNNIMWDSEGVSNQAYFATVKGGGSIDSDYNIIAPESTGYISFAGNSYNTLAAYQSGESKDAASTISNPLFIKAGGTNVRDYIITNPNLRRSTPRLSGVIDDYFGWPRSYRTEYGAIAYRRAKRGGANVPTVGGR